MLLSRICFSFMLAVFFSLILFSRIQATHAGGLRWGKVIGNSVGAVNGFSRNFMLCSFLMEIFWRKPLLLSNLDLGGYPANVERAFATMGTEKQNGRESAGAAARGCSDGSPLMKSPNLARLETAQPPWRVASDRAFRLDSTSELSAIPRYTGLCSAARLRCRFPDRPGEIVVCRFSRGVRRPPRKCHNR